MTTPEHRVPFIMEPEAWLDINAAVMEVHGLTFQELAERNPRIAYDSFRIVILQLADQAGMSQGETPRGQSYQLAQELLPESVDKPTQLQINIFDVMDLDGQELPRTADRPTKPILSFIVEPPTDLLSD